VQHSSQASDELEKWVVVNSNKTDTLPSGKGCNVSDSEKVSLDLAETCRASVRTGIIDESNNMSTSSCRPRPPSFRQSSSR